MSRLPSLLALALLAAGGAAIVAQERLLPLGLFNRGRALHDALSHALLAAAAGGAALLLAEAALGRRWRLASGLRGLLAAAVICELGVTAVDLVLVSRSPESRLGGPYWELRSAAGPWVFLKKGEAPLGFRAPRDYAPRPDRPRVLFLGDSYTEGSGRHFDCNYPQVVQRELSARLGRPVQVMNAGVGGYGPVDAADLLGLLVERGYAFDVLVFNLFLENDFTDNLPATERRVVAGINFRFPRAPFLRWMHPLNTRTFRYALFVGTAARLTVPEHDLVRRVEGACRPRGERLRRLGPGLRGLVQRRLEDNYDPEGGRLATGSVRGALERMAAVARERGVPFAVVVFPDRVLVDPDLKRLLPLEPDRWALERLVRWVGREVPARADLVVDTAPALAGDSRLYRPEDTHLSDAGNLRAGSRVAEQLAPLLEDALR